MPYTPPRAVQAACIAACAVTAGSIFCFPLFGPSLTRSLGLNLTQTNAIWSGAVLGQYISAAAWGSLADARGPRPLCIAAAFLFGAGYGGMATSGSLLLTLLCFVAVGTGVGASVFATLSASTRAFPSHPTLAVAMPLTLLSMSSLVLSAVASLPWFTDDATGDLDGARFLGFLAVLLALVNAVGAWGLGSVAAMDNSTTSAANEPNGHAGEETPLLGDASPRDANDNKALAYLPADDSLRSLVPSPGFIALALLMFAAVGGAEMVMSSVGSIVVSLRGSAKSTGTPDDTLGREALRIRSGQVQLLAFANTLSRLLAGIATDFVSPRIVSRITVIGAALVGLLFAFVYAATALHSTKQLWLLSVLTGCGYGIVFTLVPSVILQAYGSKHLGRNYGLITYAAAAGSLSFSMLFAAISDAVGGSGAICEKGPACFRTSFIIASAAVVVGAAAMVPLWRAWRHAL